MQTSLVSQKRRNFSAPTTCRAALVLAVGWAVHSLPVAAAEPTNSPLLTVDRIFDSSEFDGESFGAITWRKNDPGYYALDKPEAGGSGKDLVWHDPATDRKEVIVPAHVFIPPGGSGPLSVESYAFSGDESKLLIFTNSKRVWRQNTRGDYWVLDITGRALRQLGGAVPASTLMFAKFSPDGTRVAYVRDNNLYLQNLGDLRISALTTNGSSTLINGTADWVYEEELDLRDGFSWSPDGKAIAYWQMDTTGVPDFNLINNTEGMYPRLTTFAYPKTGEQNSSVRVGVVNAEGGDTRWLRVPGDPRNNYVARMNWTTNSAQLLLQQFNRIQNTNQVMLADAASGEVKTIMTESDAAWIENDNLAPWLHEGKQFLWLSERDGWQHAYRVSTADGKASRITKGDFDVVEVVAIDEKRGWLYFYASPENATQNHLYRAKLDGGKSERISPADQPGTHRYNISPDGEWAIHTFSSFTNPPIAELVRLPEYKVVRNLTDNKKLREKLAGLKQPASEFFRVDIGDKTTLDAYVIRPPDFDPAKKYPVLFHVYGEPHGTTVRDSWGGKAQLWHWMLAQQGYLVMSVDNRGARVPRGRAFRKSIYRQIGVLNVADQAAAVRAIEKKWAYVDPSRVGIWGWSGGGSSSLNAIFQFPDVYQLAMSVAPVPNQRYYDTIYQERYMGLPADNAEGYRLGSPVTHASKLKGRLLLVHGTGDDNVHYQGAEALINELVTHNRPFTMMSYPNRSHAISEGKNTTRHLRELLTRYLRENLPVTTP